MDRAANVRELLRTETPSRLQEVSSSNKQLQTGRKGGAGCELTEINREVSQSAVQLSAEETEAPSLAGTLSMGQAEPPKPAATDLCPGAHRCARGTARGQHRVSSDS